MHGRGNLKIRESFSRLFLFTVIACGHCGFSYSQIMSRNTGKIMMLLVQYKFIDLPVYVPLDYVICMIDGTWNLFSLIYLVKSIKDKSN